MRYDRYTAAELLRKHFFNRIDVIQVETSRGRGCPAEPLSLDDAILVV